MFLALMRFASNVLFKQNHHKGNYHEINLDTRC